MLVEAEWKVETEIRTLCLYKRKIRLHLLSQLEVGFPLNPRQRHDVVVGRYRECLPLLPLLLVRGPNLLPLLRARLGLLLRCLLVAGAQLFLLAEIE